MNNDDCLLWNQCAFLGCLWKHSWCIVHIAWLIGLTNQTLDDKNWTSVPMLFLLHPQEWLQSHSVVNGNSCRPCNEALLIMCKSEVSPAGDATVLIIVVIVDICPFWFLLYGLRMGEYGLWMSRPQGITTTTTTTTTTTVFWPFVRKYLGECISEETFTHWHLSWSSVILYQLRTSSLFNLHA